MGALAVPFQKGASVLYAVPTRKPSCQFLVAIFLHAQHVTNHSPRVRSVELPLKADTVHSSNVREVGTSCTRGAVSVPAVRARLFLQRILKELVVHTMHLRTRDAFLMWLCIFGGNRVFLTHKLPRIFVF